MEFLSIKCLEPNFVKNNFVKKYTGFIKVQQLHKNGRSIRRRLHHGQTLLIGSLGQQSQLFW